MLNVKQWLLASLLLPASLIASASSAQEDFVKRFQDNLAKVNPQYKVQSVESSHLKGFYNVQLENGPLLYVSENGQHFFAGELYFLENNKMVNITDLDSARARIALMDEFNPSEMIVFTPKSPVRTKATITVFTDVDCFYCQKLHQEVPELNARGIEVRYVAFPRAGIGSPSAQKLVSAWCNKNPQDAITKLKNQETIANASCDNPVSKQYDLGKRMGISGTPAIIMQDGGLIPGYKPAAELAKILGV